MRVESLSICHYRSIENITIRFPEGKPVVLFGPNNAGKSNILSAVNRILGERYPTYIEMLDSDYYMRDKVHYPTSTITARFSNPLYHDKKNRPVSQVAVTYGAGENFNENMLHDGNGGKIFPTNEQRAACQSYLIDAERNINTAFSYSSRYSILSKFSHKIHAALSPEHKNNLAMTFESIKHSFTSTTEFAGFFVEFSNVVRNSIRGFVHSLEVDFSAYDPNNYAQSLRIYAKDGESIRSFEEFGTGEQQVLLMAFIKAYMQTFSSENFVLIIEEPEAHLHPLALKWLKEYLSDLCRAGVQVIISTHSADFIDAEYLEGLIRVYKEDGTTKIRQLNAEQLCSECIAAGCPSSKTTPENIINFYSVKLFPDQLKGMLAENILLVEGETEYFSLPIYLKKLNFSLPEHGLEIVNCRGKSAIPLFWRIFKAYGYKCYFIFDCDGAKSIDSNNRTFAGIISIEKWKTDPADFVVANNYAYFGQNFENYFSHAIPNYDNLKLQLAADYDIIAKPGIAKTIAQTSDEIPKFIIELKNALKNLCTS